ncbi:hypothetical protein KR018_001645 [Drosophila ironensis]|nr:hypothetical protein KR018_001645 [Drosophila ironensis]
MRQPFHRAPIYVYLLLISEAAIGLMILVVTAYYHLLLNGYLAEIEKRLVYGYVFGAYSYAIQLMVSFLGSISMWRRLWPRRCTPNVQLIFTIWLFYSCIIVASGFGSMWNLYRGVPVVHSAAETSLLRGIDYYYACPEWKILWDGLQWNRECCGVNDYRDWMNAEWMPRQADNCSLSILAPYACCKRSYESCYNTAGPADHRQQPIPALTVDSINTNGCLPVFTRAVTNFIYILLALWAISLKFLIMLCCITKYVVNRQNQGDGCDNAGLTDDDGYPLVVVKYPSNVRCVTVGNDDIGSDNGPDVCLCRQMEVDYCE